MIWECIIKFDEEESDYMGAHLLMDSPKQLIRCKDCKHHFVVGENVRYSLCDLNHNKYQSDDWFCADGERREVE